MMNRLFSFALGFFLSFATYGNTLTRTIPQGGYLAATDSCVLNNSGDNQFDIASCTAVSGADSYEVEIRQQNVGNGNASWWWHPKQPDATCDAAWTSFPITVCGYELNGKTWQARIRGVDSHSKGPWHEVTGTISPNVYDQTTIAGGDGLFWSRAGQTLHTGTAENDTTELLNAGSQTTPSSITLWTNLLGANDCQVNTGAGDIQPKIAYPSLALDFNQNAGSGDTVCTLDSAVSLPTTSDWTFAWVGEWPATVPAQLLEDSANNPVLRAHSNTQIRLVNATDTLTFTVPTQTAGTTVRIIVTHDTATNDVRVFVGGTASSSNPLTMTANSELAFIGNQGTAGATSEDVYAVWWDASTEVTAATLDAELTALQNDPGENTSIVGYTTAPLYRHGDQYQPMHWAGRNYAWVPDQHPFTMLQIGGGQGLGTACDLDNDSLFFANLLYGTKKQMTDDCDALFNNANLGPIYAGYQLGQIYTIKEQNNSSMDQGIVFCGFDAFSDGTPSGSIASGATGGEVFAGHLYVDGRTEVTNDADLTTTYNTQIDVVDSSVIPENGPSTGSIVALVVDTNNNGILESADYQAGVEVVLVDNPVANSYGTVTRNYDDLITNDCNTTGQGTGLDIASMSNSGAYTTWMVYFKRGLEGDSQDHQYQINYSGNALNTDSQGRTGVEWMEAWNHWQHDKTNTGGTYTNLDPNKHGLISIADGVGYDEACAGIDADGNGTVEHGVIGGVNICQDGYLDLSAKALDRTKDYRAGYYIGVGGVRPNFPGTLDKPHTRGQDESDEVQTTGCNELHTGEVSTMGGGPTFTMVQVNGYRDFDLSGTTNDVQNGDTIYNRTDGGSTTVAGLNGTNSIDLSADINLDPGDDFVIDGGGCEFGFTDKYDENMEAWTYKTNLAQDVGVGHVMMKKQTLGPNIHGDLASKSAIQQWQPVRQAIAKGLIEGSAVGFKANDRRVDMHYYDYYAVEISGVCNVTATSHGYTIPYTTTASDNQADCKNWLGYEISEMTICYGVAPSTLTSTGSALMEYEDFEDSTEDWETPAGTGSGTSVLDTSSKISGVNSMAFDHTGTPTSNIGNINTTIWDTVGLTGIDLNAGTVFSWTYKALADSDYFIGRFGTTHGSSRTELGGNFIVRSDVPKHFIAVQEAQSTQTNRQMRLEGGVSGDTVYIDDIAFHDAHCGIVRKEFTNGVVFKNLTNVAINDVYLGGRWQKVNGTIDTTANDGSIISTWDAAAHDSIVLVRPAPD